MEFAVDAPSPPESPPQPRDTLIEREAPPAVIAAASGQLRTVPAMGTGQMNAVAAVAPAPAQPRAPERRDEDLLPPRSGVEPTLYVRHVRFRAVQSARLRRIASRGGDLSAQVTTRCLSAAGAGLGKTHLLHAVGRTIQSNRPGARVVYLSAERFMNEYIHAIKTNRMHEFRKRYREGGDVLLIDDVQFLAGKDGTQDEFFHTFNALHDAHRQIVLTADRKPHEISDIADRLRTRFAWGLMADIEPPELEVRVAILRKKASAEQIHLPDDVALYIGNRHQIQRARARRCPDSPGRLRVPVRPGNRHGVRAHDARGLAHTASRARHGRPCAQGRWPAITGSRSPTSRVPAGTNL